jgi:hypothetical protein
MSRVPRLLVALAVFACASLAQAASLRLASPANGTMLRGGSFAEVRWTAAELPPAAEEWEAFLSVDGGRYYAFRITPHLDIELRRFTFVVPNVDTKHARILIRAGNEAQEMRFENPGTFSIARDPGAEEPIARLLASGRAEAARDGDPEVIAWTSGARNGAAVSHHAAPPASRPCLMWGISSASDPSPLLPPTAARRAARTTIRVLTSDRAAPARVIESLPKTIDLLLSCRRRNI